MATVPFTFGIALIARRTARSWPLIEALLDLTLRSVRAQTLQDFRVVIMGHDRPENINADPRILFLRADWAAEPAEASNADSGRKKLLISDWVLNNGGGLLMFLDADDWLDVRLVETARDLIGAGDIGGIIDSGFAVDFKGLRASLVPHPRVYGGEFHRICGSSTVARLRPGDPDPMRRNPYEMLWSHHVWADVAEEQGLGLAHLPVSGGYLVNTSENHSELHGPFTDWRRDFIEGVKREGKPIDAALAGRFGLTVDAVRAASRRAFAGLPAH